MRAAILAAVLERRELWRGRVWIALPALALAALALALLVAAPASAQLRYLGDRGVATVGKVKCPAPGQRCIVRTPKRVKAKIGDRRFWLRVQAPRRSARGAKAPVRVRFGRFAVNQLAGRTTTVKVRVRVRRDGAIWSKRLRARLRRPAKVEGPGGGAPGGPGEGPVSGPVGAEPPVLPRPATAVDVSAVQVTWYPRDSWIRYVASGQGTTASAGATAVNSTESECRDTAPAPQPPPGLPFTIAFQPRPSWFDPASGVAGIYGQGNANFRYALHGIDLNVAEPEVEINGAASRMIVRMSGSGRTALSGQRVSLVDLALTAPSVAGNTYTYSFLRGTLAEGSSNVFAGFYAPRAPFGCVSVSFTTP